MDKEQAELYVNSVIESKVDPLSFFLAMNLVCFAVAVAFHHTIIFGIIAGCFALVSILLMVLNTRKASYFKVTLLTALQFAMTSVALNCLVFALYQFVDKFVLWEYLVSIGIQIVVFLLSPIVFIVNAKKAKRSPAGNSRITVAGTVSGAVGGAGAAAGLSICRLMSPSFSAIIAGFSILLDIMACLLLFCVAGVLYRAYLIKKFNISRSSEANKQ